MYYYSYGKAYKVKLKPKILEENPDIKNILNINDILILKTINKKEINRLKQLKNIQTQINNALINSDNYFLQKIIFLFKIPKIYTL